MLTKDERLLLTEKILERLASMARNCEGAARTTYADGAGGFAGVSISAEATIWTALRDLAEEFGVDLPAKGEPRHEAIRKATRQTLLSVPDLKDL